MNEVNVIFCDLPPTVKGMLVRTFDGDECYTVVINSSLNIEQQRKTYEHELKHMKVKDFDEIDKSADEIEMIRHCK